MAQVKKTEFDIVIVGGGLVGSALACALADSNYSVLVAESGSASSEIGESYDIRVSAISAASKNFFESIHAWAGMLGVRVGQVREMHIWDEGGSGSMHLDAAETGEACLAHIIENSIIRSALQQRLQLADNVRYQESAQVDLDRVDEHAIYLRVDGQSVAASLVVGADGARSRVREWAEIPVSGWSFDQTAIVATINTERSHGYTAFQRFLATGPLAFLPLADEHCSSIVWSADSTRARQLLDLSENEFTRQLNEAFEYRLGELALASRRGAFPLTLMRAKQTTQHRMVLVGDAAHRLHPLAGQGLNLGLADAAALAEVLIASQGDAGATGPIRAYERWRSADTLLMVGLMDLLKRLYGSPRPVIQGLRNFGMDLLGSNSLMRQMIMAFAAGTEGDVPAAMRRH